VSTARWYMAGSVPNLADLITPIDASVYTRGLKYLLKRNGRIMRGGMQSAIKHSDDSLAWEVPRLGAVTTHQMRRPCVRIALG
jgi:hypothetical protein